MDFIEQWFGFSPDGGKGSYEVLWMAAISVAILGTMVTLMLRRQKTSLRLILKPHLFKQSPRWQG